MKKLTVLAMMATLLMAGSAFAVERHFAATPNATFPSPGSTQGGALTGYGPTTTNNDDSCDISVAPAATLLLPYFEVDTTRSGGATTLFTVTNTSRVPQIAHVTVWSEYSVPVLDFNLFLTGYDVQGLNLYDVIVGGVVAPGATQNGGLGYTSSSSTPGAMSAGNGTNPNFKATTNCGVLPGNLPTTLVTAVRTALTTGSWTCDTAVGGNHPGIAKGYVTVDVANNCSTSLPTDAGYFGTEILFDNTLIGDYEQLGPVPVGGSAAGFDGAGNPMVHIRAVPEGGAATLSVTTNLPYTFYDRYTPTTYRLVDRRQPLPSTFAARYIENAGAGLSTNYKIWREGKNAGQCSTAATLNNSSNWVTEIIRFDESENPYGFSTNTTICSPNCTSSSAVALPETSLTTTTNTALYPQFPSSSAASKFGGWMFLNLNNGGSSAYSANGPYGANMLGASPATPFGVSNFTPLVRPSQNWVTIEMFGAVGSNRMSVDFDAAWLGNGCTAMAALSGYTGSRKQANIGPAEYAGQYDTTPNGFPINTLNDLGVGLVCPAGQSCATTGTTVGFNVTNVTP